MRPAKPRTGPNLQQQLHDKDVHIRNLEAIILQRDREIETLRAELADPARAEASRERTRDFWRPPKRPPQSPPAAPGAPAAPAPRPSLSELLDRWLVDPFWMRIGILHQYAPRPLRPESFPAPRVAEGRLPQMAIVTPSFNQARYVEAALASVLDQDYPRLLYAVCDGGSKDGSAALIARRADRLAHWESGPDGGQSDAIGKGFARLAPRLGPDDIMAWLNSDDLAMPGAMRHVAAEYFAAHPGVDAVYGHRVIVDDDAREVGRWVLPRHEPASLEWVDYVPQETLFWRKRAWDRVGGLDPSFHFALDWDLLARFSQAGLKIVRLPRYLGCFRVHQEQKTHLQIHSTGADEMARVRGRFHRPESAHDMDRIAASARRIRLRGALAARLLGLGIRW